MIDLSETITPKSDQLNADDLMAGDQIITVSEVRRVDSVEQPTHIFFGKERPWKPCLTMRRILILAWGKDGSEYIGRQIHLFRKPTVKFGPKEVGGIRIKALSHIDGQKKYVLTVARGRKEVFIIDALQQQAAQPSLFDRAKYAAGYGLACYQEFFEGLSKQDKHQLLSQHEQLKEIALKADGA